MVRRERDKRNDCKKRNGEENKKVQKVWVEIVGHQLVPELLMDGTGHQT